MQLSARTTCATRCTTTSAKQSTTPYRCKTDHRNQIFAKNLFCKSFILQTYIAGGEMRVQIWHKVWNPVCHRIRRGEKNHFFISSVFLTHSSSQGLSYRDKDRVQDWVRWQVSFDILLLGKQIQSPSADVRQSTRTSARLNTRRFTMKFVKMPHRKPW